MKVVVIGNGLAGTIFAKTLRERDPEAEITIYSDEPYLYYPRPNLIEFLAGKISTDRLFAFPEDWYSSQNIQVHLECPVKRIGVPEKEIELSDGRRDGYDKLLLANGSFAFIPPFKGADKKGVFTLRTLADALAIRDALSSGKDLVLIGGGLLGLEIARAVRAGGAEVQVVEFFPRLLPRQLDSEGAELLKTQIEALGIRVHLGKTTEEIQGTETISGLRFKDGKKIPAGLAIVAAGVRPEVHLAREAGLETDKGVIVDDRLQTSQPDILAAGDNVQHRDRWYGIIPASFEQARTAAGALFSGEEIYEGTIPANTLKIVGMDVTSLGLVNPEEGEYEEIRYKSPENRIYKKIVLRDNKVVGAICMGTKQGVSGLSRIMTQGIDVGAWKNSLLEHDFDFSIL